MGDPIKRALRYCLESKASNRTKNLLKAVSKISNKHNQMGIPQTKHQLNDKNLVN